MPVKREPCESCPYRIDCPSGVWHENEYLKLAAYDGETQDQPLGPFMCHASDRKTVVCRGWFDVHKDQDGDHELLGLRIGFMQGVITEDDMELPDCETPLHPTGLAACEAGMQDMESPSAEAAAMILKLNRQLKRRLKK